MEKEYFRYDKKKADGERTRASALSSSSSSLVCGLQHAMHLWHNGQKQEIRLKGTSIGW